MLNGVSTVNEYKDLIDDVHKIHVDLYEGRGKNDPSITSRLAMVEDCIARISTNLSKITWIVIGILGAIVTDIVSKYIK